MAIFECNMEDVLEKIGKDKYDEGEFNFAAKLYKNNDITLEVASKTLGITEEEFLKKYDEILDSSNDGEIV